MNVHFDQNQDVSDAETNDLLHLAIQRGQPLAGYLPTDELLRSLIRAVCEVSDANVVHVFLKDDSDELVLRAMYTEEDGIKLSNSLVDVDFVPEVYHSRQTRIIKSKDSPNAVYYVPFQFTQLPLGVLRAEGKNADGIILALELVASYAACGLASSQLVRGNRVNSQYDKMEELIERTRLSAMSELAAAVSHQLNNPLTTILADTEILMLDAEEGSRTHRSLSAVARAGRRAAEVVRRLMAVSRPDKLNGVPQQINVVDTIDNVLQLVNRYIEVGSVEIIKAYDPNVPKIWVVPNALEDVWMNLLMNARDALLGREDAKIGIEVSAMPDGEYVRVVVWDNGVGVPDGEIKTIFDPFYTTKSSVERMGLGLHTSKQIIENMDGSIAVEPRVDGGTQFTVYLPMKKGF